MQNLEGLQDKILNDIRNGRSVFDREDILTIMNAINTLKFYGNEDYYDNKLIEEDRGATARVTLM